MTNDTPPLDLAHPRLGTRVVEVSDEFFAVKERMIDPADAVFVPGLFDDHGKWMDGWETRRRRGPGHDRAILRLGVPGVISRIDIDTSHFTGNYPPAASLEGCICPDEIPGEDQWRPLVPTVGLRGDTHNLFTVDEAPPVTHVRLNIFPDGGVARLRLYGDVVPDWPVGGDESVDLAALELGGRVITFSDAHYGDPLAILARGPGLNMEDGWETARRREPGHEWIIVALGHPGRIDRLVVDTMHNLGNYPDRCSVHAGVGSDGSTEALVAESMFWPQLLGEHHLGADQVHEFGSELSDVGVVTHLRLNIHPDGGISRFRAHGRRVSL